MVELWSTSGYFSEETTKIGTNFQVIEGMDNISNILRFEQSHEEIKEEVIEIDMEKWDNLALMVQTPANYDPINKMTILEVDNMEVNEEVSNKRIKIQYQGKWLL